MKNTMSFCAINNFSSDYSMHGSSSPPHCNGASLTSSCVNPRPVMRAMCSEGYWGSSGLVIAIPFKDLTIPHYAVQDTIDSSQETFQFELLWRFSGLVLGMNCDFA